MKRAAILLLVLFSSTSAFAKANFVIINNDQPGKGFNDPTPAAPVAGNNGTTLGEQRLNTFKRAGEIWGAILDSDVDIRVEASFAELECTDTSAVLGSARTSQFVRDFPNAPKANTLYPVALASKFAKTDLANGGSHIIANFNSKLDSPTCFGGVGWYYGFDAQHGAKEDLLVVVLHEFAHGLGFAGNVDAASGRFRTVAVPAIFDLHVFDETTGLRFDQMTDAQRRTAALNTGKLVWDGPQSVAAASQFLGPTPFLTITAGGADATYTIAVAGFGGAPTIAGLDGSVVAAQDESNTDGPVSTDACTALTNASAMIGKFALIDRGSCNFTVKAKNAQNAGAAGVIIVDNRAGTAPPGMSGDDASITIPVISVTQNDGAKIRSQLSGGASGRLYADASKRAGASNTGSGMLRLYAPGVAEPGSSLYHWDTAAFPNLLMEPSINGDLQHRVDLTLYELADIGWIQMGQSPGTPSPGPVRGRTILRHPTKP
jgi:hypothetical protein